LAEEISIYEITALLIAIGGIIILAVRLHLDSKNQKKALTEQTEATISQRKSLVVSTFAKMIDWIGDEKIREAKKEVWNNQIFKNLAKFDPESSLSLPNIEKEIEEKARDVAVAYDKIGFVIRYEPDLEADFLAWHGLVVIEMWKRLRPLIIKKWRKETGHFVGFEYLAKKAMKFDYNIELD